VENASAACPARMKNPTVLIPGAWQAIQALQASGGVPAATLRLVHLRASQVNGCSLCVDSGWRAARDAGETDKRLFSVAAWREVPYFTMATTNLFNRLNVTTRPAAGAWG
jgi:AhpD family alkylhydroperoxidase